MATATKSAMAACCASTQSLRHANLSLPQSSGQKIHLGNILDSTNNNQTTTAATTTRLNCSLQAKKKAAQNRKAQSQSRAQQSNRSSSQIRDSISGSNQLIAAAAQQSAEQQSVSEESSASSSSSRVAPASVGPNHSSGLQSTNIISSHHNHHRKPQQVAAPRRANSSSNSSSGNAITVPATLTSTSSSLLSNNSTAKRITSERLVRETLSCVRSNLKHQSSNLTAASSATTNSRLRQGVLYARRHYYISSPQDNLHSHIKNRIALRAQQQPQVEDSSHAAAAASGSSSTRVASYHHHHRANHLAGKSQSHLGKQHRQSSTIGGKTSASKFSLTSSTSSLSPAAVKRVKPSLNSSRDSFTCTTTTTSPSSYKPQFRAAINNQARQIGGSSCKLISCASSKLRSSSGAGYIAGSLRPSNAKSGKSSIGSSHSKAAAPTAAPAAAAAVAATNQNFSRRQVSDTESASESTQRPVAQADDIGSSSSSEFDAPQTNLVATSQKFADKQADLFPKKDKQLYSSHITRLPFIVGAHRPTLIDGKTSSGADAEHSPLGSSENNARKTVAPSNNKLQAESITLRFANVPQMSPSQTNNTRRLSGPVEQKQQQVCQKALLSLDNNKMSQENSQPLTKSRSGQSLKLPLGNHHYNNIDQTEQPRRASSDRRYSGHLSANDSVKLQTSSSMQSENLQPHSGCDDDDLQNIENNAKSIDDLEHEAVVADIVSIIANEQSDYCDDRLNADSTDTRKSMDYQEDDDRYSGLKRGASNSMSSKQSSADDLMVLGSPLVSPPPSDLDIDEISSEPVSVESSNSNEELKVMKPKVPEIQIITEPISNYYDLETRPFARGEFAQVKRCISKSSNTCFAAKCIKKRRRLNDIRHEIMLEIEALKLSFFTERIVKLYEVYETQTEIVLILEMANGGELQRVLDDEEFIDERLVRKMVEQILEGLVQLHDNDIAHLDIKPQNLLLTETFPNGDIKLCDFGISRRITKDCEIREICGTPDYVAPEILSYDPISLATDMWSLGVLTYVLLSGYSPFGSESKLQTFCNITQATLDFPHEIFDKISQDAIDFMQRLIVREPSERLTSRQAIEHPWLRQKT